MRRQGSGQDLSYPHRGNAVKDLTLSPNANMKNFLTLAIMVMSGCIDHEDDPRDIYAPHYATSWHVTNGGIVRDAGPFHSVSKGYLTEDELDVALDAARAEWLYLFPELPAVNPYVHLTDDYVFWVSSAQGWASGMHIGNNQIMIAIWSRGTSYDKPSECYLFRAPGDSFGTQYPYYRYTTRPLVPAYQHECLHVAIGDASHSSVLWERLK